MASTNGRARFDTVESNIALRIACVIDRVQPQTARSAHDACEGITPSRVVPLLRAAAAVRGAMMNEAPIESIAGRRYGRYEALVDLASGGMGAVAVGRLRGPNGFRRLVAIKTVHSHLTRHAHYTKMFMREADLASRLHHPNVVPVLELGQERDEYFLVMEYFPSMPLSRLINVAAQREVPIPPGVAIAIAAEACAGLETAHNLRDASGAPLNLVHRDVTPTNVLVGEDGTAKLTDFGIARARSASLEVLTGEGSAVKGKLAYLSPEQARGAVDLDRRSDVFALGIVLHELITGQRLFKGDNEVAIALALLGGAIPDVRKARPDCPAVLAAVVARALQRDPRARYQTAAEFQRALLELQREFTGSSRGDFIRSLLAADFLERHREIAAAEALLASENATRIDGTPIATAVRIMGPSDPRRARRRSEPEIHDAITVTDASLDVAGTARPSRVQPDVHDAVTVTDPASLRIAANLRRTSAEPDIHDAVTVTDASIRIAAAVASRVDRPRRARWELLVGALAGIVVLAIVGLTVRGAAAVRSTVPPRAVASVVPAASVLPVASVVPVPVVPVAPPASPLLSAVAPRPPAVNPPASAPSRGTVRITHSAVTTPASAPHRRRHLEMSPTARVQKATSVGTRRSVMVPSPT